MPDPMIHAVDIQAPAPTVFEAISTKVGVASFWTSDIDLESVVGSIARFGFPAAPVALRMRIQALEPIDWSAGRAWATSHSGLARRWPGN